jgi:hypothetical protein
MAQADLTPAQAEWLARYNQQTEGFEIHAVGDGEAFFSWAPCDTCGCVLGGDRFDCTLIKGPGEQAKERIEVRSCTDCVLFAANGTLPEEG